MKERIVVKDEIFADFLIKNKDNHDISASPKVIMDRCKVEQVPENFEEMKELCKGMFVEINEHSIIVFGCLEFWDNGTLAFHHYCDIVNNLKPQQMWNIIKNLIGEE